MAKEPRPHFWGQMGQCGDTLLSWIEVLRWHWVGLLGMGGHRGCCRDSHAAERKCNTYFQRQLRRKVLSRLQFNHLISQVNINTGKPFVLFSPNACSVPNQAGFKPVLIKLWNLRSVSSCRHQKQKDTTLAGPKPALDLWDPHMNLLGCRTEDHQSKVD